MAYAGTTSTSPNPPRLVVQGITGYRKWVYVSTHISSDVEAAGFITDGYYLGMKVADTLEHVTSTGGIVTTHSVLAVTTTGADLSVGSTIGLAS